jgi:biotin-(acetyl-CoA carboxylase) ligase
MALVTRSPARKAVGGELSLPPVFTAVRLREMGDAFAHAQAIAAESGAGTLVHVGRFDLAEFALVLEPEEPLRSARRVFYAGMAALADTLVAHAVPETVVGIEWPDAIYINYGLVGGGRLAWPKNAGEDAPPPWLVFGAMIRMATMTGLQPGANLAATALDEEGFAGVTANAIIESFTRNFMAAVDGWQANGFGPVTRDYVQRLPPKTGLRREIDDNGDLVLRQATGGDKRESLVKALASPSWIDPKTRMPIA